MENLHCFTGHWRNYVPSTYYITHSMGPVMWATGATPKKVTAFTIYKPTEKQVAKYKEVLGIE